MPDLAKPTEKRHTSTNEHTGPVLAHITCPTGNVYVTVDPAASVAAARVLTRDDANSPAADAVRNTQITQTSERLVVVVPDTPPTTQNFGLTGMTFNGGMTVINGVQYSGNVSIINGRVIGGTAQHISTGIEVHLVLPAGSGVHSRTEAGSLQTYGPVAAIDAKATNGGIKAETVGRLKAEAGNGSIKAGRVTEWIDAEASNGSINVDQYAGSACRVRAGNGSVTLTATPAASGRLDVKAGNGSVRLYGVRDRRDLDVRADAGNGTVKKF